MPGERGVWGVLPPSTAAGGLGGASPPAGGPGAEPPGFFFELSLSLPLFLSQRRAETLPRLGDSRPIVVAADTTLRRRVATLKLGGESDETPPAVSLSRYDFLGVKTMSGAD